MLIKRLGKIPEITVVDKTKLRELLHTENDNLDIPYSLAYARLPAGETSKAHRLTSTEVYYIISGTGEMHIGEESEQVGPGDAIVIPPKASQYIKNIGTDELAFICIVSPAWKIEQEMDK